MPGRKKYLFRDAKKPKSMRSMERVAHKEAVKVLKGTSEEKRYFATWTGTIYNGFTPIQLTTIPQGSTDTARIGDACKPLRLRLSLTLSRYVDSRFRVIVFLWKADTAISTPALNQILENTTYYAESEHKHDNQKVYRILHDKSYLVDAYHPNIIADINMKLRTGKIQFNAGGTAGHGHIYFAVVSNDVYANGGSFIARGNVFFQDV